MQQYNSLDVTGPKVLGGEFLGENVRVYLVNGAIISGKLSKVTDNDGYIDDMHYQKQAIVTWRHVISITRY